MQNKVTHLNFYLCDYEAVNTALKNIDWTDKWKSVTNINEMLQIFYDNLMPIL